MATSGKQQILKNCTIFWVKCTPEKPEPAFGTSGPRWSLEIRTNDKKQADEWKALGIGVKLAEDGGKIVYKASLRKQTHKKDGTPYDPVKFVNGQLDAVAPGTVANGSVGNIRIWANPFQLKDPKSGAILKEGTAVMLQAVQLTKHVVYVPKKGQDFDMTDTEVVDQTPYEPSNDDDAKF